MVVVCHLKQTHIHTLTHTESFCTNINMPPRPRAPKTPEEALSRALAKTLRHAAKSQGIPQDSNGWCSLDVLLKRGPYINMKATPEQVEAVVAADKKGRYEFDETKTKIRAVQGHSVKVDVDLVPLTSESDLPEVIVHGTYKEVLPLIEKEGLKKMGREFVHMASGLPSSERVISGMRQKSEVYIYIDGPKALKEGIQLYKSKNGVILTPDVIPPHIFKEVTIL